MGLNGHTSECDDCPSFALHWHAMGSHCSVIVEGFLSVPIKYGGLLGSSDISMAGADMSLSSDVPSPLTLERVKAYLQLLAGGKLLMVC